MWTMTSSTTVNITTTIITIWLLVEAVFVVIFYKIWLPRFQQLRPPEDYRGYSRDRRKLLCRILSRVEKTCKAHNLPLRETLKSYVREWFHPVAPVHDHRHHRESGTISNTTRNNCKNYNNKKLNDNKKKDSNYDTDDRDGDAGGVTSYADNNQDDTSQKETWWPKRGDMDHFFAWAFFGRKFEELEDWMRKDMERMYETIETHYGLVFRPGTSPQYKPMRLSLDPLQPAYRPFVVYAFFSSMKLLAGLLLRAAGFYACKSSTGLMYFYRPARKRRCCSSSCSSRSRSRRQDNDHDHHHRDDLDDDDDDENDEHSAKQLPLIFLHGIAPGGLFFYIPMLFFLGGDGRPLLFFENPDISFYILGGYPPNESETVVSVWEAVNTHLGTTQEVCLIGHSFGSCPITWLLHSSECLRIRQIVLVDPVSILLSEPDVVQNFLYQRHCLRKRKMPIKIGVVSNEIFTEHYLRRHFSWYNSELWLEDLPDHAKVLVCLSNDDSIVPSQKVHREVLRKPDVDILVWENAGHAHCVTRPRTWKQIQMLMKRQEQRIFQESSSSKASPESSSSSSTTLESITIDNNLTVTTPAREKKIT